MPMDGIKLTRDGIDATAAIRGRDYAVHWHHNLGGAGRLKSSITTASAPQTTPAVDNRR